MNTVGDIFDAFGGLTAVARILGKGVSTVSEMKRRGSIDVRYWRKLMAAAGDPSVAERDGRSVFDLTSDTLVAVHVPEAPPSEPAAVGPAATL